MNANVLTLEPSNDSQEILSFNNSDIETSPLAHPKELNQEKRNMLTTKENLEMNLKRECLEIRSIKQGDFFSSRVLVDEAQMKNYIKNYKDKLLKWIKEPDNPSI